MGIYKKRLMNFLLRYKKIQTIILNMHNRKMHGKEYMEKKESYGEDFPDKTFYVIRRRNDWGLMSILVMYSQYFQYANRRSYIPVVDMCNVHNLYLDDTEIGKRNSWEYFFEQPGGVSLSEIKNAKNVIISAPELICAQEDCYMIDWDTLNDNRILKKWNLQAKEWIKFKPDIKEYISEIQKQLFDNYKSEEVVGCYCRGSDYIDLKPGKHPVQPSADEVIDKAKEVINIYNLKAVYLVTEDERILQKFQEVFGKKLLYISSKRYGKARSSEDYVWKRHQEDRYISGRDYLTGMMLLSFCDYFLGGVTGGTAGFMLLNEKKFRYKYFWDLGRYE